MFNKEKEYFFRGGGVCELTEDALLVFLVEVLKSIGNHKYLFLSESDELNKRIFNNSRWFSKTLTYYPEKDTNKTVPGFISHYNRYRSNAIIKIATTRSVCCLSTFFASKKADINKKTKPVVIKIKKGDVFDRDKFIKITLGLGYNKVDNVFSTGDLSVKGDIVDVFPVYEKEPVRLSFGFDNIESISFFNIDTQITTKTIKSYDFWDVFGREVDAGRALVDFVPWDAILSIVRDGAHYSVFQKKHKKPVSAKTNNLQTLVNSKSSFLSFLKEQPSSRIYLFCVNKSEPKPTSNKNVKIIQGKLNNAFCVNENNSFYFPFWGEKPKKNQRKTSHKPLLNNNLNKTKEGDLIVHVLHGVGLYGGLKTRGVVGFEKEYIKITYAENGVLYVPLDRLDLVHQYKSLGGKPKINKLGKRDWEKSVSKTKKEIEFVSDSLIDIHRSKNKPRGFVYKKIKDLDKAIKQSFPYKETKDQKKAIKDVLSDLKKKKPMDRLVCGDVGFGKTEVALRAIVRVVSSDKQVVFLCPTTVLSDQHYISMVERLKPLGIRTSLLSRFQTKKEQNKIITELIKRQVDVVVGTHRVLSDDVICPQLGLLIIDEEHRFGVKSKESIRAIRPNVDLLSLSATPIPRTLQQSILGIRDISRIETPPITRKPIKTYVEFFSWSRSLEIIKKEVVRGGQVYFLHNDIQSIDYYTKKIQSLVPDIIVKNIHGQQKSKELEKTLLGFFSGSISVLVCSTIIESGLDVANANCIIINNPQNLGLSQLYQIRGRVGRGSRQAFCYLFVPPKTILSEAAFRRLKTVERHTTLGSGYSIASNDLDIRGAGLVFGYKQSGVVSRVGVEYYNNLLKNALNKKLNKVKEKSGPSLFFWGKSLIPIYYVPNSTDRFSFYTKINNAKNQEKLSDVKKELKDRFGPIPNETISFINLADLRLLYIKTFVEDISINENSVFFGFSKKSVNDGFIDRVLSYKSNQVVEKRFKEKPDKVQVCFLTTKNFGWYLELIKCINLFYKT